MMLGALALAVSALSFVAVTPATGEAEVAAEVAAAQAEFVRGLEGLKLEGSPRAYYVELRMVRADILSLDGSYGGLVTDVLQRQATATLQTRVGSPEQDDTGYLGSEGGTVRFDIALDPSPHLTRKKVWLGMDTAFRGATRAFANKQNVLARLSSETHPPSFAPPPEAVTRLDHVASLEPLSVDRQALANVVAQLSTRYRDWSNIDNGDVHVQVMRTHELLVTSEGLVADWGRDRAVIAAVADAQAADGMHLDHGLSVHLQHLPVADAAFVDIGETLVDRVLHELDEMVAAPMIEEEYDGPLLFLGPAAGQFLATLIPPQAAGNPAPLSDGGRIIDLESRWQTKLGKNVMPPFLDVIDDPTLKGGFGSHAFDAEGFTPQSINLVKRGVLQTLLMTRTPNEVIRRSNGRARMTPALEVGPSISNLIVHASRSGLSRARLERELLRRAQEDGYEFAYVIESLRDGVLLGPVPRDTAEAYAGTGKIPLPLPARVFRLEQSGRRTLVRGAVLAPTSVRVLRRIREVGASTHVVPLRIPVGIDGGFGAELGMDGILGQTVDVQIAAPDFLIEGLELMVERGDQDRLPTLIHPLRRMADDSANAAENDAPRQQPKTGD